MKIGWIGGWGVSLEEMKAIAVRSEERRVGKECC